MTDIAQLGVKIVQEGLKETNDRLTELVKRAGEAESAIEKIRHTSQRGFAGLARAAEQANADVIRLAKSVGGILVAALGAVSSAFSIREFIRLADTWSDLSARVQNAIGPHEKAADVMRKLSDMARVSYSDLGITTEAFINNAQSLQELGLSTDQQLKYQEALNNALVVSGARADRAASVQHAFSSALALGALRGDQLNSVLINGDRISKSLAKELGVTTNELRKLGAQGKITREVMLRALINDYKILRDEAEQMPATVGDGMMLIKNATLVLMGTWDKFVGISGAVANGLVRIADIITAMAGNVQEFTKWFITIGTVLALNVLPRMALFKVAVLAGNTAIVAMRAHLAGVAAAFVQAGGGAAGLSAVIGYGLPAAIAKAKVAFATFLPTAIIQVALILIGFLIAKFYEVQKAVGGVGTAVSLIFEAMKWEVQNFDRTLEMIFWGMLAFYYRLVALGEQMKEVFRAVVFDIKKRFTALPDEIQAALLTIAIGALVAVDRLLNVIYDGATKMIDIFRDAIPAISAIFSGLPAAIGKGVVAAINFVLNKIKEMIQKAMNFIRSAFPEKWLDTLGLGKGPGGDGGVTMDLPPADPEPPRSGYTTPAWIENMTGGLETMRQAAWDAADAIKSIPRPRDPSWERHGSPAERAAQQAEIYARKGREARAGADGQGNPYVAGMRGAMQAAQDAADQAREDAANLPSIEEITLDALNSPSGGGGPGGGGRGGGGRGGAGGAGGSGEKSEAQKILEQQQKALSDLGAEVEKYRATVYMTALEEEIWNKQKETGAFLNPQLAEQVENMVRELDRLRQTQELVRQIADDTKQAFESAFTTIITGSGKARDALRQLLDSLAQMAASRAFNALWGMVGGDSLSRALAIAMGGVGRNANGTNNWRGGLTSVNERGGEIIDLPNGSRVIPHDISRKMANNSQNNAGTLRVIIEPSGDFRTEMDTRAIGAAVQVVKGYDKSTAMNKKIRSTVRNPRSIG